MTQRIHSPAGEPFDLPAHKDVSELLLLQGWTRAAPDPKAEPLIHVSAPSTDYEMAADEDDADADDFAGEDSDSEEETPDVQPRKPRGRTRRAA